jgi:hypothetical protein
MKNIPVCLAVGMMLVCSSSPAFASAAAAKKRGGGQAAAQQAAQQAVQYKAAQQAIQYKAAQQAVQYQAVQKAAARKGIQVQSAQNLEAPNSAGETVQSQAQGAGVLTSSDSSTPGTIGPGQDLGQIWEILKHSSEIWKKIPDKQIKGQIVSQYIALFKEKGITVAKPPGHYVAMLDQMAANGSEVFAAPFIRILQIVSVMEYDFDFGQDKEKYALQVLGQEIYSENKKRLGRP